jgi:hypothetical protein
MQPYFSWVRCAHTPLTAACHQQAYELRVYVFRGGIAGMLTELILTSVHMVYSIIADRVHLTDTVVSVTSTNSSVFYTALVKENSCYAVKYM